MQIFEPFAALLAALYSVVPSFGVAIILLTIVTRLILLPLSIKQTHSMREMQRIQPEVKKLQQKHKGDRQKLNEATMALYKEHGVNPFGGCLPLLLQFPVLIALYRVIQQPLAYMGYHLTANGNWVQDANAPSLAKLSSESSLAHDLLEVPLQVYRWLGLRLDCSLVEVFSGRHSVALQGDQYPACSTGSPWLAILPYVILIGFMGWTTYYQQRQMQGQRGSGDPQAAQMQMIGRIMPIMLIFFGIQFPAALVVYWLTTNLWTIGQQHLMLGRFGPSAAGPGDAGKPAKGGDGRAPKPSAESPNQAKGPKGRPEKGTGAKPGADGTASRPAARSTNPSGSAKKKRRR